MLANKTMNLIDELGNEIALAFLVEKKYSEKVNSKDALELIGKVRKVLEPTSFDERSNEGVLAAMQVAKFSK